MDFINRNLSGMFKTIIIIAAVLIFIRIVPWLIVVGIVGWGGIKLVKYIKSYKNIKTSKREKVDNKSKAYEQENYYDFSNKNVVDVEYEEVKSN
ncbi:hypothetical protein [Clostridium aciditolerans]|uniref:DUF4834 domain-containing protein n=1 Tax=Clostridium aciditolerans TaxID=339861 RepID=A0A934HZW5_9CLOT|nr:hypothetical protein [Clostridium aciditolerans]MBI6872531.1 hypothetical protein [Clostridium aciditolerans]